LQPCVRPKPSFAGTRLARGLAAPFGTETARTADGSAAQGSEVVKEATVSTENWAEERERLVRLLEAIESGKITHVDEEDLLQLQATNEQNIAALKGRLAELNTRLGTKNEE
jgi:hypothetical protein